ncbi:MAG: hypothetical protein ACR2PK_10180 [Acidimicrobiales bacterium]
MTGPTFHDVVAAIDRANVSEDRRHQLLSMAIGRRYLDAGSDIAPNPVDTLDFYTQLLPGETAAAEAEYITYADILAQVNAGA